MSEIKDVETGEILNNLSEEEAPKKQDHPTVILSKGEFRKHKMIKEELSRRILTVSGSLSTDIIHIDRADELLLKTAKFVFSMYGKMRAVRAWNDLILHSLLHIKDHKIGDVKLYYEPMMEYFGKFGGVIVKVHMEEEKKIDDLSKGEKHG